MDMITCMAVLKEDNVEAFAQIVAQNGDFFDFKSLFLKATSLRSGSIVRYLVDVVGADIYELDSTGDTPLMISVKNDDVETARFLMERGSDMFKKNHWDDYPLESACYITDLTMLEMLLSFFTGFGVPQERDPYPCFLRTGSLQHKRVCSMLLEAGFRCKSFDWRKWLEFDTGLTRSDATFWERSMALLLRDDRSTSYDYFIRVHEDQTTPFKMCVPFWDVGRQERLAAHGLAEEAAFAALCFGAEPTYFKSFFQYMGPVSELILRYLILPTAKGRRKIREVVSFLGKGLTRLESKKAHLRLRNVREVRPPKLLE
jgi:hypothetical protein